MSKKDHFQETKQKLKRILWDFVELPWEHVFITFICVTISVLVFAFLNGKYLLTFNSTRTLTNLLSVNGVFSAILITYLFSRITWDKERKLEVYKEAIALSQKVTDYRRILNKLTTYFSVWENDRATKNLIDSGKFKSIDFYDYRLSTISDYVPYNSELIKEFSEHKDFQENISILYLAMVSLIKNRNNSYSVFQEELYNDFEIKGLYNIKVIEKWMECEVFGIIWSRFDRAESQYINYNALRKEKEYILSAVSRINSKYDGQELNNDLIKNVTDDFSSHYLKELYLRLQELKRGVTDLNRLIITLITISLVFGVLFPFLLLLIEEKTTLFLSLIAFVASINAGLISYFVLRFPTLINRELKWI